MQFSTHYLKRRFAREGAARAFDHAPLSARSWAPIHIEAPRDRRKLRRFNDIALPRGWRGAYHHIATRCPIKEIGNADDLVFDQALGPQYHHLGAHLARQRKQPDRQRKKKTPIHYLSLVRVESISSLAEITREFIS
jgi:hypothetical protein